MSHYWGVYMLQEPVTRDKHRVPIEKYEPEVDPSGAHWYASTEPAMPAVVPQQQCHYRLLLQLLLRCMSQMATLQVRTLSPGNY
jgi:hypothetical protein